MEQMETVETPGLTDVHADDARPIPTQQEQPFYKSQKEGRAVKFPLTNFASADMTGEF